VVSDEPYRGTAQSVLDRERAAIKAAAWSAAARLVMQRLDGVRVPGEAHDTIMMLLGEMRGHVAELERQAGGGD
jgi:hypothetical protein